MNKPGRDRQQDKEEMEWRRAVEANPLLEYSTTQLKKRIKERKRIIMTKYKELLNKDRLISFITMLNKGYKICGLCYADRKM